MDPFETILIMVSTSFTKMGYLRLNIFPEEPPPQTTALETKLPHTAFETYSIPKITRTKWSQETKLLI